MGTGAGTIDPSRSGRPGVSRRAERWPDAAITSAGSVAPGLDGAPVPVH